MPINLNAPLPLFVGRRAPIWQTVLALSILTVLPLKGAILYEDDFEGATADAKTTVPEVADSGFSGEVFRNAGLDGTGKLESKDDTDPAAGYFFQIAAEPLTADRRNLGIKWTANIRMPSNEWIAIGFNAESAAHFLEVDKDTGPFLRFTQNSTWVTPGRGSANQLEIPDTHSAGETVEVSMMYYPLTETIDLIVNGTIIASNLGLDHEFPNGTSSKPVVLYAQIQFRLQATAANGGAYIDDFKIETLNTARELYDEWVSAWPGVDGLTGREDDPDRDGLTNLGEYAFGGHPGDPFDRGNQSVLTTVLMDGVQQIQFSYSRRSDAFERGISYALLDNETLSPGTWRATATPGRTDFEVGSTEIEDGFTQVINRAVIDLANPSRFFTVKYFGAGAIPELWTCTLSLNATSDTDILWAYASPNRLNEWANLRSNIKVLKVYINPLGSASAAVMQNLADISLANAFKISVEIGGISNASVVYHPDRIGASSFEVESQKLLNFTSNGGVIHFLSMDDPIRRILYPMVDGEKVVNNLTISEANAEIVKMMQSYRDLWPHIEFIYLTNFPNWGWEDGPAYNKFSYNDGHPQGRGDFKEAFADLYLQASEAGIQFFAISADNPYNYYTYSQPSNQPDLTADVDWRQRLLNLEKFTEDLGLRFILIANIGSSTTSEAFQQGVFNFLEDYKADGGTPFAYMIQSWYPVPLKTLPETDPFTLSNTALEALGRF